MVTGPILNTSADTQQIPATHAGRQTFITILGAQEVRISLWWQPNDSAWYMTLEHPVGTPIVVGRRIMFESGILSGVSSDFVGNIHPRSLTEDASEPGLRAWGTTHILVYDPRG